MNKKLQKIFQSYLLGRVQLIAINENIEAIIHKKNLTTMMAHLPLEHLISIKKIRNVGQAGLTALFQGKLLDAKRAYITANDIIKSSQLNH